MIHDIIGHISFGISAVSFMMRRILLLRLFAITSLLLSLYYNYFLPTGPLWVVLFWLVIFLVINIYQSSKLILDNIERDLTEQEKEFLATTFPLMRSRDFKKMISIGELRKPKEGELIVSTKDALSELLIVQKGVLNEKKSDYESFCLMGGAMIGEATYILQENYGGSPSNIYAGADTELFVLNHDKLRAFFEKNPDAKPGFLDGVVRGMIKKKGFLLSTNGEAFDGAKESILTEEERKLHAIGFPKMLTSEVKVLFTHGTFKEYKKDEEVKNTNDEIGVIVKGAVIIDREDGQHIKLATGNFIGEIKWVTSGRDVKVKSQIHADSDLKIIWWTKELLEHIQKVNPSLFASFTVHVARDMGIKLSYPLTEGNVYDFSKLV